MKNNSFYLSLSRWATILEIELTLFAIYSMQLIVNLIAHGERCTKQDLLFLCSIGGFILIAIALSLCIYLTYLQRLPEKIAEEQAVQDAARKQELDCEINRLRRALEKANQTSITLNFLGDELSEKTK